VSTLVIGPVPVFDPELEALTGDRSIVVEGGTIVDVLDASAPVPASATRVAAEGKVAIPGLIDCHVHLCYDGDPSRFTAPTEKPGMLAALAMKAMHERVAAGVPRSPRAPTSSRSSPPAGSLPGASSRSRSPCNQRRSPRSSGPPMRPAAG